MQINPPGHLILIHASPPPDSWPEFIRPTAFLIKSPFPVFILFYSIPCLSFSFFFFLFKFQVWQRETHDQHQHQQEPTHLPDFLFLFFLFLFFFPKSPAFYANCLPCWVPAQRVDPNCQQGSAPGQHSCRERVQQVFGSLPGQKVGGGMHF
jgi:hypothetical protein